MRWVGTEGATKVEKKLHSTVHKKNNQTVAGKGRWVGSLRYKSEQLVGANKVKVEILDTPFLIRKHESILPTNIHTTVVKKNVTF